MGAGRRKVGLVVTARASYARVKSVIDVLNLRDDVTPDILRVTEEPPDDGLEAMASITGMGVIKRAQYFALMKPDIVLTVGDRYETLATAIAASYQNIPLAHLQGGEVTGSIDEKVRHAVTKLADLHFVCTEKARERVIRMGEDPAHVFMTGCPSLDLLPQRREAGMVYLVVVQHPVTTELESAGYRAMQTALAVRATDLAAHWVASGPDAGRQRIMQELDGMGISVLPTQSPESFGTLLAGSACVVGNSSMGIRECSYLGIPAVNIGTRQSGRERGANVLDVGHDTVAIINAIRSQVNHGPYPCDTLYGDGKSGERIVDLLASLDLGVDKRLMY